MIPILVFNYYIGVMTIKKVTFLIFGLISHIFCQEIYDVSEKQILVAMQNQTGYNISATTNVARFQAAVLLDIAKKHQAENPNIPLIFLDAEKWYHAFKTITRLDDKQMPEYSRLAKQYKQHQLLDIRQEKVYRQVMKGRRPHFAMNVVIGWNLEDNPADHYTFLDTMSTPTLDVLNKRIITYKILDFGDIVSYENINGISGQPTSGVLGFIFQFIGKGEVMWSRATITWNGLQIVRARAKKGIFEIESTLTVYPDGNTIKNLPDDQPELQIYEKLLTQPTEIEFLPIEQEIIKIISEK